MLGPGLGTGEATAEEIRAVIAAVPVPLVIDADALTALGGTAAARVLIDKRSAPSILTPHDGEYARLNGRPRRTTAWRAARALARATGAVVLLKGSLTAVAAPDGGRRPPTCCWRRPAGRRWPRRAAATCSRASSAPSAPAGLPPLEAAAMAAHVHGRAASLGPAQGLVAGDLPDLVAEFLSELVSERTIETETGRP